MRLKRGVGKTEAEKDYVFTGPEGGFLNLNYLREKTWSATLTEAKLRRRTFYQTRHTFTSNALAAGENPKWVADMLSATSLPDPVRRVREVYSEADAHGWQRITLSNA